MDHYERETWRTMKIRTEEYFKIDYFTGWTALRKCQSQQWANINNSKYWCHTVNHITIESRQKGTWEKIKKIPEEKNIGFDLEWSWDIWNREKVSKISSSLEKVNLKNNANKHRRK